MNRQRKCQEELERAEWSGTFNFWGGTVGSLWYPWWLPWTHELEKNSWNGEVLFILYQAHGLQVGSQVTCFSRECSELCIGEAIHLHHDFDVFNSYLWSENSTQVDQWLIGLVNWMADNTQADPFQVADLDKPLHFHSVIKLVLINLKTVWIGPDTAGSSTRVPSLNQRWHCSQLQNQSELLHSSQGGYTRDTVSSSEHTCMINCFNSEFQRNTTMGCQRHLKTNCTTNHSHHWALHCHSQMPYTI